MEGPGYTEPPMTWQGQHDPEWTFTGWAEERGYSSEWITEVNHMYPEDPREVEAIQDMQEREIMAEARGAFYDREYTAVREVRGEPDPYDPTYPPNYPDWPQAEAGS